jgi:rfaE bifunctional protein kinase chain/domain
MNIKDILERASNLRIAVIGDRIVDRYIDGIVERISPEAPVPILKITGTRENPGGAGNVVENLRGLGCEVDFFFDPNNLIIKTRVMSGNHHLLRMDDEETPKWMKFDDFNWPLWHNIEQQRYNCVVLSDYHKGVVSEDVASKIINLCGGNGIPVVVDTKRQHEIFSGATLVKCNSHEWGKIRCKEIYEWLHDYSVNNLVVTDGAKGMSYWGKHGGLELSGAVPGIKTEICDPCGAGDTVLSVLAIMMALGDPVDDACELANIAAAKVCQHPGVYAIKKEDLI